MSAIYTSNVQFGSRAGDVIGLSNCYLGEPWTQKSTGAITVTAEAGVIVAGLTIGQFYCIEARVGPWQSGEPNTLYTFAVSNDAGVSWSDGMGYVVNSGVFDLYLPVWAIRAERADNFRARMFWEATTTSIKIRVADGAGQFGDNGGNLSYKLNDWLGPAIRTNGVRLG
jgi:hypothetical protein